MPALYYYTNNVQSRQEGKVLMGGGGKNCFPGCREKINVNQNVLKKGAIHSNNTILFEFLTKIEKKSGVFVL